MSTFRMKRNDISRAYPLENSRTELLAGQNDCAKTGITHSCEHAMIIDGVWPMQDSPSCCLSSMALRR